MRYSTNHTISCYVYLISSYTCANRSQINSEQDQQATQHLALTSQRINSEALSDTLKPPQRHAHQLTSNQQVKINSKNGQIGQKVPTPQFTKSVPMPETTKKATKRTKHTFRIKPYRATSMRQPNPIGSIYSKNTGAIVADEATEKRLSQLNPPSTSVRYGGMQFIH